MNEFIIVPLDTLHVEMVLGHNKAEQVAITDLDHKPAGEGWGDPPAVTVSNGQGVRLKWRRPLVTDVTVEK